MVHVRPYRPTDHDFIVSLAPRLTIGMPAWHRYDPWIATVHQWIRTSIAQHGDTTMVLVAEDAHGNRVGFATVSRGTHWTGEPQATIGELATHEAAEGQGVGTALVAACEQWARDQGYRRIALMTGAANTRALGFYHHVGFADEDITLIKQL